VDAALIDRQLSADMEGLFELVTMGSAARNTVKIKVRQPLAEMKVQPGAEAVRRAVERFGDQLREELNIKKVTLHDGGNGALLDHDIKPNMKTLGPKYGARAKEVLQVLAAADPAAVASQVLVGKSVELPTPNGPVTLEPADVLVQVRAPEGWAGAAEEETQVAVDTRVTEELKREGMAREIIRHVNEQRKKANLEMDDPIVLHLGTDSPALRQAIEAHRDSICRETLAVQLSDQPLVGDVHRATVRVDGQPLTIELRKVSDR
jgi:isoleucyl-tRNA synthetase